MATNDPTEDLSTEFLPASDVLSPDDQLAKAEDTLDIDGPASPDDLVIESVDPPPLGRSWAFDFGNGQFVRATGSNMPLPTYGETTLLGWIEKCLHTERGASPIHPEDYGLEGATAGIGENFASPVWADLEDRVRAALTFHPRVSNIEDFDADFDPDDEYMDVTFEVLLDDETRLTVSTTFWR